MKSIAEAFEIMFPAFSPRGTELRGLDEAAGLYSAEPAQARFDWPAFDNSAMDGYAVRAEDVGPIPCTLPVIGESRAGGPLPDALRPKSACRIFTGAPMPAGADTVILQEDTTRHGDVVSIEEAPRHRQHVRQRASDLLQGATLLQAGAHLGPGEIALLASQNIAQIRVHRPPTVALLCTGDEIRELGTEAELGAVYNSNQHGLSAQLRALGCIPTRLPIVPDKLDALVAALRDALGSHDVVITTGGVSVGEYDFVQHAFEQAGIALQFWKVQIKPGKPFAFALGGDVPVIGLPGNPVSALVTFEALVAPCLRHMLGDAAPHPLPVPVQLSHDHRRRPGRTELARARLHHSAAGWQATLHSRQGSGSLHSLAGIQALVILPADRGDFVSGDRLQALPWGNPASSGRSVFMDHS